MHEHLYHYLFTAFPLVLIAVILLKRVFSTSRLQVFAGIMILFLVLVHHAPLTTVFAYHHQADSSTGEHPW